MLVLACGIIIIYFNCRKVRACHPVILFSNDCQCFLRFIGVIKNQIGVIKCRSYVSCVPVRLPSTNSQAFSTLTGVISG